MGCHLKGVGETFKKMNDTWGVTTFRDLEKKSRVKKSDFDVSTETWDRLP